MHKPRSAAKGKRQIRLEETYVRAQNALENAGSVLRTAMPDTIDDDEEEEEEERDAKVAKNCCGSDGRREQEQEVRPVRHKLKILTPLDQVMTTAFTSDWVKPRPKTNRRRDNADYEIELVCPRDPTCVPKANTGAAQRHDRWLQALR